MSGYFRNARQRYLGVDIGLHAIKVVELSRSHGTFQLESYGIEPLAAVLMDDLTRVDPKSAGQALVKALGTASVVARDAVVAVPDTQIICKNLELDAGLSEDDLELYVRLEAEQYIPYALEELALDFEVMGCVPNNPERLNVLLVTCRQQTLDWYEAVLSHAGLKARVIAVHAHALERALEALAPCATGLQTPGAVAVVDFAPHTTVLSVVREGQLLYSRELLFGCDALADEAFNSIALQHIRRGLEPFVEPLASLVLSGAAASRSGLSTWLEAQLGLPTQVANPFALMRINPLLTPQALLCDAPLLLTACGLALRGFD